jgi:alkylation response protein AidB-like acyl-CoA dehydrogenase
MDGFDTNRYPEIQEEFREFGSRHLFPVAESNWEAGTFNHKAWDALSRSGFWKEYLPEDNVDWLPFCAALEALSETSADSGFVISMVSQAGLFLGLKKFGSENQKELLFPKLEEGAIAAIAIAEPHTGTQLGSLKTSFFEGHLRGDKFNISHAHTADILLILGRMPELGKRDITTFLIGKDSPGLYREEGHEKVGNRTLPTGNLRFDGVPVSGDDILGLAGEGLKVIGSIGSVQRAMYGLIASAYLHPMKKQVEDFLVDRAGADSFLVQEKLERVRQAQAQLRDMSLKALQAIFSDDPEASLLASKAKLESSLKIQSIASDLISLLGSRGHFKGLANRLKLDAQGWLWIGGTEEAQRLNIAKHS